MSILRFVNSTSVCHCSREGRYIAKSHGWWCEYVPLKDLADKQKAEEEVFKKLVDTPVSGPYDEHNRSTPRSSLIGLAVAAREKDYERAVNYLDLRNLPFSLDDKFDGQDLVRKLLIVGPLRFLIMVLIFRAGFDMIAPSLAARAVFEAKTLLVLAIFWVLLGVVDLIMSRLADRMKRNGQEGAVVLLKPASTGVKLIVGLLALISWMDNLGYQVTTILAGLGVGGVAVALAAQKSLENLIGSITIYVSQPVHVGDFCQFGDTLGTVEEIGLRATQLRTLARTVVHVPNAMFAAGKIENLTQRDKILYRTRCACPITIDHSR